MELATRSWAEVRTWTWTSKVWKKEGSIHWTRGIKKQGFWHRDPRRGQFVTMIGTQSWDKHRNWVVRTGCKTKAVLAKKIFYRVSVNWARALMSVVKSPELWGEDVHQRLRTWWSLAVIRDDTGAWTQLPLAPSDYWYTHGRIKCISWPLINTKYLNTQWTVEGGEKLRSCKEESGMIFMAQAPTLLYGLRGVISFLLALVLICEKKKKMNQMI